MADKQKNKGRKIRQQKPRNRLNTRKLSINIKPRIAQRGAAATKQLNDRGTQMDTDFEHEGTEKAEMKPRRTLNTRKLSVNLNHGLRAGVATG